jgi:hypothetical protein
MRVRIDRGHGAPLLPAAWQGRGQGRLHRHRDPRRRAAGGGRPERDARLSRRTGGDGGHPARRLALDRGPGVPRRRRLLRVEGRVLPGHGLVARQRVNADSASRPGPCSQHDAPFQARLSSDRTGSGWKFGLTTIRYSRSTIHQLMAAPGSRDGNFLRPPGRSRDDHRDRRLPRPISCTREAGEI